MANRLMFIALILAAATMAGVPAHSAALKDPERARQIAILNLDRDDGHTLYRQVVLVTCRYAAGTGRHVCQSRPVKKEIENVIVDINDDKVDEISLGIITAPPSEKNMAFLQQDFHEPGRESDQWMYFPAMKKLKRIISQSDGSPKTGSVFGSEIAYEDAEKQHAVNYDYSYEGTETVDTRVCDKIIALPKKAHQPKTSYSKEVVWIDRESRIALKKEVYSRQGTLAKTFFRKDIVKTDGVWIDKVLIVVNHQSRTMSMEKTIRLAVNIPLDPEIVTNRALNDVSFRESIMRTVRHKAR